MVDFFIKRYAKDRRFQVAPEVITALQDYEWPGNVRELENVIERAVVLSSDNHITMDSLPANLLTRLKTADSDQHRISADTHSLAEVEKRAILGALDEAGGNRSKAARILKVPRHVLLYRLKKLNIDS